MNTISNAGVYKIAGKVYLSLLKHKRVARKINIPQSTKPEIFGRMWRSI